MGKYAGGGRWNGHAKQDFGRDSAGQNNWEVREIKGSAGEKDSTAWNVDRDTSK